MYSANFLFWNLRSTRKLSISFSGHVSLRLFLTNLPVGSSSVSWWILYTFSPLPSSLIYLTLFHFSNRCFSFLQRFTTTFNLSLSWKTQWPFTKWTPFKNLFWLFIFVYSLDMTIPAWRLSFVRLPTMVQHLALLSNLNIPDSISLRESYYQS